MRHLGAIRGSAQLKQSGTTLGQIDYTLSVPDPAGSRVAHGTLVGPPALIALLEDGACAQLQINQSEELVIVIERLAGAGDAATFIVSGKLPPSLELLTSDNE